nr:MAG TPA: hypothetical protein [Caudoviricetes sp.]
MRKGLLRRIFLRELWINAIINHFIKRSELS